MPVNNGLPSTTNPLFHPQQLGTPAPIHDRAEEEKIVKRRFSRIPAFIPNDDNDKVSISILQDIKNTVRMYTSIKPNISTVSKSLDTDMQDERARSGLFPRVKSEGSE